MQRHCCLSPDHSQTLEAAHENRAEGVGGDRAWVLKTKRDQLDCVESSDIFLGLSPKVASAVMTLTRRLCARCYGRPLFVAIAAAVESYVAEKACEFVGSALRRSDRPARLNSLPLTLGAAMAVEATYTRRGWGWRRLVEDWVESEASSNPDKIGMLFSAVGARLDWRAVDARRKVGRGTSQQQLHKLCSRRNVIAHTGDIRGSGKAHLSIREVELFLVNARSIVEEIDRHLAACHPKRTAA